METKNCSGYEEVPHTADMAMKVWAPDLVDLLRQAAAGMQTLMGLQLTVGQRIRKSIDLQAEDAEGLLVGFLSELLYWMEVERMACDRFYLAVDGYHLTGFGMRGKIAEIRKEFKAVTYHQLKISTVDNMLETTIVFDV